MAESSVNQGARMRRVYALWPAMRSGRTAITILAGLALGALVGLASPKPARPNGADPYIKVPELTLRSLATHTLMPQFPSGLEIRDGDKAVVVSSVSIDREGKVRDVTVLTAPSEEAADSVRKAVRQWTFTPRWNKMTAAVAGANGAVAQAPLTFYFTVIDGVRLVRNPDEMPTWRFDGGRAAFSAVGEKVQPRVK